MNSKQLLGFQDLGLRGFTALRNSHIEATQARWDVDGVFNTKLSMAGLANAIQILGSSKSTDGLGHVLNIQAAYRQTASFENAVATYYVGLMYAEVPAGLRINPLTGKPQFDSYVEEVGIQAAPNSVVDNGNGTITMVIDSATEAGVTNAGRTVRVWKVTPADGGTTLSIAMEELTSVFTGGQNKITTAGKFGQTAISTTASDYLVTVMGPRVSRNTDLSAVPGVVFIGTVLGNGATPVTFSNANQTLLKTFQDATQVTYAPTGWLSPGATTVQLALDTIISGLGDTVSTGTSGAGKIGVYSGGYNTVANGGIGNAADSTYTAAATVADILLGIDAMARRRQTFQTKSDGSSQLADDSANGQSVTPQISTGRPQWLRTLNNASTTPYIVPIDTPVGPGQSSYIIGEFSDPTQANAHLRKTRINTTTQRKLSFGKWQRVWLDANAGFGYTFGGANQRYSQILEDFGANGGTLLIETNQTPSEYDTALNWRNGVIVSKIESTKAQSSSLVMGNLTNGWIWSVMEKLLIMGNTSAQTGSRFGALTINNAVTADWITAATVSTQGRPLVFRDCVFVAQDAGGQSLINLFGDQAVLFENCRFFDIANRFTNDPMISIANAKTQVTFRDCVMFSPEGNLINSSSGVVGGLIENCSLICGIGGQLATTAPTGISLNGGLQYGLTIRDTRIYYAATMFRQNATATATPLLALDGQNFTVDNLLIKCEAAGATTVLGWARLANITCTGNPPGIGGNAYINNIVFDLGGRNHDDLATKGPIYFSGFNPASASNNGRIVVDNLVVRNTQINAAITHNDNPLIQCDNQVFGRNWLLACSNTAPTRTIGGMIKLNGDENKLADIRFTKASACSAMALATIVVVGNNNVIDGITHDETCGTTGTGTAKLLDITGNDNHVHRLDVTQGSDSTRIALFTGRDCEFSGNATKSSTSNGVPVTFALGSTNRRNRYVNNNLQWNGNSNVAVDMLSQDSLVDSSTFYRTSGATAAVNNVATGSVTGSTITSTAL